MSDLRGVAVPALLCALVAGRPVAVVVGEDSAALPAFVVALVVATPLMLLVPRRDAGRLAVAGAGLLVMGAAAAPVFAYLVDTEAWNVGGFLGSVAVIAVGVGFLVTASIWRLANR